MAEGLKQYKGNLTASQIADGINAAAKNAKRLYEDAQLLFDNARYPSALALAILSIEESGKASILRSLSLVNDGKQLKESWKRYRSHKEKNTLWIAVDLMIEGAKKLEDFSRITDPHSDHPELLDQLKQVSLYTDCLGSAHWSSPEDVVDKDLAAGILRTAEIFSRNQDCTKEHISLWIKHMGPVQNQPPQIQNQALLNWFKEMRDNNYMNEGGEISFIDFLGGPG